MNIRRFVREDADFCFRIRSEAFITKFCAELSLQEVAAGVNHYMPSDFIRMAETHPVFVCEQKGKRLGLFALRRHDKITAELLFLYVDLQYLQKGIGTAAVQYAEEWIQTNWKEVTNFIIDTAVPKYNSGFYEKVGFTVHGESACDFGTLKVGALRLRKQINKNSDSL